MRFTLTIDMDNAAFEDEPGVELGRLVRRVGHNVTDVDTSDTRYGANEGSVLDSNGNTVGRWEITS